MVFSTNVVENMLIKQTLPTVQLQDVKEMKRYFLEKLLYNCVNTHEESQQIGWDEARSL